MFEACVEVRFETKIDDDRVVVTVDVCINAVEALEDLEDKRTEGTREWYTYLFFVSIVSIWFAICRDTYQCAKGTFAHCPHVLEPSS